MQKIVFLLLFTFSGITSFCQQEFFVYLQADNHQPFYTRIKSRMFSSTETGYMIIPKLGDSTYEFVVGFAKSSSPEQSFTVAIDKKDKGFQLKNLGEKGWCLANLQNGSIIMNQATTAKTVTTDFSGVRKTDQFSGMLANVVNDSAILYTVVKPKPLEVAPAQKPQAAIVQTENNAPAKDSLKNTVAAAEPEKVKMEPVKETTTKTEVGVAADTASKKVDATNTVAVSEKVSKPADTDKAPMTATSTKAPLEKPFITKVEEKTTAETYQAIYLEQYNFSTDTIRISIPLASGNAVKTEPVKTEPVKLTEEKKTEPVPEKKIVAEEKAPPVKPVVVDTAASVKRTAIEITNSDCKGLATDYDVDKLRVKLLNDKTIDDKLVTARKYFKTKCLSVKQIRALTELFPSDETKYRFFDVSYPYVLDSSNFHLLEELIENSYYKNRFKAMISK